MKPRGKQIQKQVWKKSLLISPLQEIDVYLVIFIKFSWTVLNHETHFKKLNYYLSNLCESIEFSSLCELKNIKHAGDVC